MKRKPRLLKCGDRVRMKVYSILGWRGTGTVVEDQIFHDDGIVFHKDGYGPKGTCLACRHEVALMRVTQ